MPIEMTIKGLMVDSVTNTPIVVLRDHEGQRVLPIRIGVFEANAIALQIENVEPPRPMTHDLLRHVIEYLRGVVDRIEICDLRDNTFFAKLHLQTSAGQAIVDARPSDAIALALRTKAPILVEESVIESAKQLDNAGDRPDSDKLQEWLASLDAEDLGKYKM